MKKLNITTTIDVCSFEELTSSEQALIEAAKEATNGSYAPYSHFHVGAALELHPEGLFAEPIIIKGANQENASYPVGTCAERSALFWAGANYPEVPVHAIAIAVRKGKEYGRHAGFLDEPGSPCGICRQALSEVEHKQGHPIQVLLFGSKYVYRIPSVEALLPLQFTSDTL